MSTSIRCAAVCSFNDILHKWSRVDQPHYVGTDFPYLTGAWNQIETDPDVTPDRRCEIVVNNAAECIHLRPKLVLHNHGTNDNYPHLHWYKTDATNFLGNITTLAVESPVLDVYDNLKGAMIQFSSNDRNTGAYCIQDAQGFYIFFSLFNNAILHDGLKNYGVDIYIAIGSPGTVGTVDNYVTWYRFNFGMNQDCVISYSASTEKLDNLRKHGWYYLTNPLDKFWRHITSIKYGNSVWDSKVKTYDKYTNFNGTTVFNYKCLDVQIFGGKLIVSLDGQDSPFVIPLSNSGAPLGNASTSSARDYTGCNYIGGIYIENLSDAQMMFHAHPYKFVTSGIWESADHQLGFAPLNNPSFTIDGAQAFPTNTAVSATLVDPITAKYQLSLTSTKTGTWMNEDYADFTPTVRAVNFSYARIARQYYGAATILQPESLNVQHNFDYNSLQIHSNASMTFNNNRGQFSSFFNNAGQNAVDITLQSSHIMPGIQMQAFSGIGNRVSSMRGAHGSSMFTMEAFDRSVQLENPRWALPWMDGWNEFSVQYYLSQLGGIHPDQMGYAPYIPPDQFNVDLGDEFGNPAWYLPVGAAGTALTRFSGINLWDIKSRIAFAAGKMLYFDAYGVEQYRKFLGPATFVKRTFFEDDSSGYPLGCHSLSIHRSLEDVRNQVTVVGIDAFGPLWNPIVSHYSDDASINDPYAFNHIGYPQPIVWADSMFANTQFAEAAAQRLIAYLRMPTLHVQFSTWLNPDIYPLDTIGVDAPRFGIAGLRFMVVSVSHHLDEGSFGSTSITARWMGN